MDEDIDTYFNLILNYFDGDLGKAIYWFSMPNTNLGGGVPIQLYYKRPHKLFQFIEGALNVKIMRTPEK